MCRRVSMTIVFQFNVLIIIWEGVNAVVVECLLMCKLFSYKRNM